MFSRIRDLLRFRLERLLLRGAGYRLLIMAGLIGLVTAAGGTLALWTESGFAHPGEALWWAFLRLTDPGYLGDDQGLALRTISTILTVLGYVLFMGSLIAILTQWLNQTINKLEKGLTPISKKNHVVILGWTTHTPLIIKELILGRGRVKRFLKRHGSRQLSIAILSEAAGPEHRLELRQALGDEWDESQILFRTGTPLKLDHLRRADFAHAAALILPGTDLAQHGTEVSDARSVKTLLSLSRGLEAQPFPYAVAEIFDAQKAVLAERAYGGRSEIVASEAVGTQLLFQGLRHPGISLVIKELFSHDRGNALYVKEFPELAGQTFHEAASLFSRAVALGLLRGDNNDLLPMLNPAPETVLGKGDKLVFIAEAFDKIMPEPTKPGTSAFQVAYQQSSITEQRARRRILCFGWNSVMPFLIESLDCCLDEHVELDIFSRIPTSTRSQHMSRLGSSPGRVQLQHLEGDFSVAAQLSRFDLTRYNNIVILGPDWMENTEEADARTVLCFHLLVEALKQAQAWPDILVEIFDPENEPLISSEHAEVIVSPVILSHIVAHVTLRPELNPVFHELFGSRGPEISFAPPSRFGLQDMQVSFAEIQGTVSAKGAIALGVILNGKAARGVEVELNPDRSKGWTLGSQDKVLILSNLGTGGAEDCPVGQEAQAEQDPSGRTE